MSEAAATHEHVVEEAGSMPGVNNRKFGMWLFIASEVMFFTALIGMYLAYHVQPGGLAFHKLLNIPGTAVNTFILLTSSLMVVLALNAIQSGNKRAYLVWLALVALLGAAFIGGQVIEFSSLYRDGATLSSDVYGSTFFVLTGFHGMHVVLGILWALVLWVYSARGGVTQQHNEPVELFGLYWHFVDVVWIILFTVIYLLQSA